MRVRESPAGTVPAIVNPMTLRIFSAALIAAAVGLLTGPALARCSKNLVEGPLPGIKFASLDGVQFASGDSPNRAVITFVGHASYQIDTPQGVRAITDYNGMNGFGRHPDIVTMNNAHDTHFTDQPKTESPTPCAAGPRSRARPRRRSTSG